MTRRMILSLGLAVLLLHCKAAFDIPPNHPPYTLSYPPGITGDLPQGATTTGSVVPLQAVVVDYKGRPVKGAEVLWDDAVTPFWDGPITELSDVDGRATFPWQVGSTLGERKLWAIIRGANGSPLEYRAFVLPGKGPPPGN
jgi:hypothetical protein